MKKIILYLVISLLGISNNYLFAQESRYHALYLFNFTKYINWGQEEVTIGVMGNSQTLIHLTDLVKQNSKISLIKISEGEAVTSCNMIFLPKNQARNFSLIQEKIGASQVILVVEDEALLSSGAEIAFFREDDKLRFAINKPAIDELDVKVSPTLLSQGKIIR